MFTKNKEIKDGDIFIIKIKDDLYSYGQIIESEHNLCIIYDLLGDENEILDDVIENPIMFITKIDIYTIKNGIWKIIGNNKIPENIEFPISKNRLRRQEDTGQEDLEKLIKTEYRIDGHRSLIWRPYHRDKDIRKFMRMDKKERYKYFIESVVESGEVWSISNDDEFAIIEDNKGNEMIPIWSGEKYAQACVMDEWQDYNPVNIDLSAFIEEWIPNMDDDSLKLSVSYINGDCSVVELDKFKQDLKYEVDNHKIENNSLEELSKISPLYKYSYFIEKILETKKVWSIYDEGFTEVYFEDGTSGIPLWYEKEHAEILINDGFENNIAKSINLDEFIDYFLPYLIENEVYLDILYDGKGSVKSDAKYILDSLEYYLQKRN